MTKFKRTISWKMLSLYGLGNILGAGIYVLIGEVARESGDGLVWSFLVAGVVALFTAITYGALASKYPVSAGAAIYTARAFKSPRLSSVIGLSMALTAVVSASALLNGFDRYFSSLLSTGSSGVEIPSIVVMLSLLTILGLVAFKGIKDSTRLAVILTLFEAAGLVIIIFFAGANGQVVQAIEQTGNSLTSISPLAIALGGFVAFYAFIGFEDMVNVAEEVKNPKKSMRKGVLGALLVASVLYILVALSALSVLDSSTLAESSAPLSDVFTAATNMDFPLITIIGLIAITNGALIGIITGSRILYGLAKEGWLPKKLAYVSPKRNTPTNATWVVLIAIALMSVALPLGTLAQITSLILLMVFTFVQVSALKLIRDKKLTSLSPIIPVLGIIANVAVISLQVAGWLNYI